VKNNRWPKAIEFPKPPTADEIAKLADRGEGISRFFTNAGKMMPPVLPEAKEECHGQED
jgi:hypothetical protein